MDCFGVVIKAQQILSTDGKRTNKIYDKIKAAGGIHPFLGYEGIIILSSIMPDKAIYGFSAEAYAEMIDAIRPDFYLTPDGETYLGEIEISALEISRVVSDSKYLIASCLHSHPIGLIKGCNLQQIDNHTVQLLELGLSRFVFHAGEYLCRGTLCATDMGIAFASAIRKRVPWLGIYGIGAMKSLRSYSFADGYITQSHFVNPFYGRFRDPERMNNSSQEISRDDIMNELSHINQDISAIELQSTLSRWLLSDVSEQHVEPRRVFIDPTNSVTSREGM
ncbi:MAG: hypothetical protein A4E35_00944 [Methanoregula sp. PtaU1.Bin051]|nr:MAG: hypothetical protein A4E35_00944 [Methanoregula sp. PtaU1.Bin051]